MSERTLASIQVIEDIQPIPKYDNIEYAQVLGWWVIVRKGEYVIGDKTIYIEIDSVLPPREEYEFLRKRNFRIKTMRMAGVVSQGICFKPELLLPNTSRYKVGDDVTEILGVEKYEPDQYNRKLPTGKKGSPKYPKFLLRFKWFRNLVLNRKDNRGFPRFISKTDETRIQNMPFVFKDKETQYIVREKIDGQSTTFFLEKKKLGWLRKTEFDFGVCSRNLRLWKKDDSPFWFIANYHKIEDVLKSIFVITDAKHFVAIQGETISPSAQGNKYLVSEPEFYAFNFIVDGVKINSITSSEILMDYGISWCPLVATKFTFDGIDDVEMLMHYVDGRSHINPNVLREGFVFRNEKKDVSFKCVSNKFLLKYNE